jgi:alpha-amylase/alpha-mannosidase (GH57 family)
MQIQEKNQFLTIHGHFYQPPRENPWLESIELQDSALPFHDWNERINSECYNPNSVSRIVDHKNKIIDIVNNYGLMSFNFGPTLMSWLEQYAPKTYERVIKADCYSVQERSGHGNAIAQVYNHIIMPLANEKDKYTQTIWGIKDFQYRFGRSPEGMWLAETAVDDDTMRVLADCGIKFTILSPYQALKIRPINKNSGWTDVSWGNIDPARAYRYYIKDDSEKFIDVFFYDGAISKSVAFDNLLKDGDKFIKRLQDGLSSSRDYNQLVHIATDGESYGHHTKFGDMALSYIQKIKASQAGFKLTNYGEYLEKHPPVDEVDIKQKSSWSCFHGVDRWVDDCGCSTGGHAGWNQRWRKPLRKALDALRDELVVIYETQASKYLKDPWNARNRYINIILDRNEMTINKFCSQEQIKPLSDQEKSEVIKLLEMQRQAMLMYTSCGWFFSEISGIETVQIMKYAARAIQLADEYSEIDLEGLFLNELANAKSNIPEYGTGKDVYEKFVRPSIVTIKQVVSHWAISSLFEEYPDETEVYCYNIKNVDYRKVSKGNTSLVVGRIQVSSRITLENHDMVFALLHFSGEDFHCAIKDYTGSSEYTRVKKSLIDKYTGYSLTETIRMLDESFGKEYYTLKDIFIEERRKIIDVLIRDKISKFSSTYKSLYEEGKGPILQLYELGSKVPSEFKIAAEYTLSRAFNKIILSAENIIDHEVIQEAFDINNEAKKLNITLDKEASQKKFSQKLTDNVFKLAKGMEQHQANTVVSLIDYACDLEIDLDLTEAQNVYFNMIHVRIPEFIDIYRNSDNSEIDKKLLLNILIVGEKLDVNIEPYRKEASRITPPAGFIAKN